METSDNNSKDSSNEFKKPVLVGRVGKLPRKVVKVDAQDASSVLVESKTEGDIAPTIPEDLAKSTSSVAKEAKKNLSPAELLKEQAPPLPYKEPKWSGLPPSGSGYKFEVLKSGTIVETINLTSKPFHVFGRLSGCDIIMAHPTISRFHAVLQYKAHDTEDSRPKGFYLYDLGSSHGTIVNKIPVKPNHYVRLRVGYVIKLGCSTRLFILQGPEEDTEEESELSLTEMKQLRLERKQKLVEEIQKAKLQREKEEEEKQKKMEQDGISWGMAEDAEEETDLSENPYAQASNEELYLDDPKKTLRGYFEREGCNLEYDCQERGISQFVCRVELPIEDARGNPVIAEVVHKGKKKDAVVQCALEACRIIDRHGLLRQAKHESRKRKAKNWKDDDYYDSDDDTFLDRTGVIEKKRERRMKEYDGDQSTHDESTSMNSEKPVTYNELVEKCKNLRLKIEANEKKLSKLRDQGKSKKVIEEADGDGDALDQFMKNLGKQDQGVPNKAEISKTKLEIQKLKIELERTEKLSEIAKPAALPELIPRIENNDQSSSDAAAKSTVIKKSENSIFIGKKISKQTKRNAKPADRMVVNLDLDNGAFEVEVDSDEDDEKVEEKNKNEKTQESPSPIKKPEEKKNNINKKDEESDKKIFGPMRPPVDYVIPDDYYNQENGRDLPEITETVDDY